MPTYEYACTECGERIEIFQRISDPPLDMCDVCGGTLRKLFHPAGIVFKGSGFYATDSRRGKSPAKAERESSAGDKVKGETGDKTKKQTSDKAKEKTSST